MYDRRRLSIDKIKEQVEAIDVARGSSRLKSYPQNSTSKEIDPYFETSNNFSEKPVNPFPIPYDIGNAETKYEPVINVDEDEDDVIVDTLIEDEEEEIVDLQIEVNNFQASQEPVLPKEDRKNLSHAEDKSLVYYDRETLNEEDRNIMLSAIEQHILTPQYDRAGNLYFNPTGTVSRAESINALECFGKKGKSIDGVSEESDYYNEGYNELVSSVLNNFCNLYTKENLYGNIRRCELAYMVASHPHHNFGSNVLVKDNVSNLY
ncbi:hypothetical protein ACQUY5_24470, partial [Bacillus cereus]|uniref:hypothetical protein n=1 Tax=Bacillus cereus TaxID=1396 RepID=UPI003D164066